jgi:hypothetical protein
MSVQDHTKIVLTGNFFVVFVRRAAYPAAFGHIDVVARRCALAARVFRSPWRPVNHAAEASHVQNKKGLMISHKPLIYNVFWWEVQVSNLRPLQCECRRTGRYGTTLDTPLIG